MVIRSLRDAERERTRSDRGAVVIVPVDEQTGMMALVIDDSKHGVGGKPAYWKFPGGKIDPPDEDLDEYAAALRELKEETKLSVSRSRIWQIGSEWRGNHTLFIFVALAPNFDTLGTRGDEGERVSAFELSEIQQMSGNETFFPVHRSVLDSALRFIRGE